MLSHVENCYQPSYSPWKPQIQSKVAVFVGDPNGVGHATAVILAAHGAPVFLAARTNTILKQAFADINRAGGECDGMVVDWSRAEEYRRFFMLAEAWLGGIDAIVTPCVENAPAGQNLCMQVAIQRMQGAGRVHIININVPGEDGLQNRSEQHAASALRRQARELGIRVTLIEPRASSRSEPGADQDSPVAQIIARCVLESLAQPYGADGNLLPGPVKPTH